MNENKKNMNGKTKMQKTKIKMKKIIVGVVAFTMIAVGVISNDKADAKPSLPLRDSFYGNINIELGINGNSNLPIRVGGGTSFDLGYIFGNNRVFINSGIHYLSGTPATYRFFDNYNVEGFTFLHVPLTLNYGVMLNTSRVSFIPSIGFGYSFTTTYAYDTAGDGGPKTYPTGSFIVAPKLSIIYNTSDNNGFIGGTMGGYVFSSKFLKLSYAVVGFTGGTRF